MEVSGRFSQAAKGARRNGAPPLIECYKCCGLNPLMRIKFGACQVGYACSRKDSQRDGDPPNQNAGPEKAFIGKT